MTGATGFLGQFVLRELLKGGRRVAVMLRAPLTDSRRRLVNMMRPLGIELEEYMAKGLVILCEGSLPESLPDGTWGPTDDILACAASLQLYSKGDGEPYRTNVEGTERLLDWANRHHVTRLHAVSTAYVCGSHENVVKEVFHPRPAQFQTEYEETKWVAEEKLADWSRANGNTVTVLRPSFIIGDSTNGYTTQFGGFYQFARMISILKEELFSSKGNGNGNGNGNGHLRWRIPGKPDDRIQNLVPVDYAAKIIASVILNREYHGQIFHVTDPKPPTWDFFRQCVEEYFGLEGGGYFVDHTDLGGEMNEAESLLWEKYDLLMGRIVHQPDFDESNTSRVRVTAGIDYPVLNKQRFFKLLEYAVSQRWGQRANRRHARAD